ncbi:stabilizer of axonemal microtubules 4 [Brachyistius frenatus]|uniref:stabilizer of axonemal microtubules 4 n=1 Tax=Brachyistius frenatus TaxID=100188 RepID=UPI0037E85A05
MAEQWRIVIPTAGATGRRGQQTSNTLKLHNAAFYESGEMSFTSNLRRPSESGFTSNQRPAVYYRPSMDAIDNPRFGLLLSDNFMSQTKLHYQPHIWSDCLRSFPNVINKPNNSGFHQLRSHSKAVALEAKTDYQTVFVPPGLEPAVFQSHVTVGPKEETGFTEGAVLQLNTFQEKNSCTVEPGQAHSSVMKSDFTAPFHLQGTEAIPSLSGHSCRETGFTRGVIHPLDCPSSLLLSAQTRSSASNVKIIGKKEPTGSLRNGPNYNAFPKTPFHCSHFNTHYNTKFCHPTNLDERKCRQTPIGIIPTKMDPGYSGREMDRFIFRE